MPGPTVHADLGAAVVTVKMAEEVVAGPAELVTERSVVVGVTTEAETIFQAENPPVVTIRLPLFTGVQHGGEQNSLNQLA